MNAKGVDLVKVKNGLKMTLTQEGSEFLAEVENDPAYGPDELLWELLEYQLCNGWMRLNPEDIGALTSAPIISEDVVMDDNGNIVDAGDVFWYADYQIFDPVAELIEHGEVVFNAA